MSDEQQTEAPPEGQAPQEIEEQAAEPGAPELQQAITVGNMIVSTTTIDALFTAVYATRSADLAATPVYTWAGTNPPQINATWAAATAPSTMMVCKFEVRNVPPSSVLP